VTNLGRDYFIFDESRQILRGRRTGRVFAMGQKVKVQLAQANVQKRQIDFELIEAAGSGPPGRYPPAGARPAGNHPPGRPGHPRHPHKGSHSSHRHR
jgi:ribonuclease R